MQDGDERASIVKQHSRPTVYDVIPLAKSLGITDPVRLFELYEAIMVEWQDHFVED